MHRFTVALIACLAVAAVGACSQSGGVAPVAAVDSASDFSVGGDLIFSPQDTKGPTAKADTAAGSCEFSPSPLPGAGGSPCSKGGDCDSGWCLEGPSGKLCTVLCADCCPSGFACKPASPTDVVFVCVPQLTALCRPCQSDSECAALSEGALCIGDPNGRFCGGACAATADCPADYACQTAVGTSGSAKQCVRKTGECACSPKAISDGAKTACSQTNAAGTCTGARKCVPAGLSACDAAVPATETCGGGDENCNGQTDEPGAVGCQNYYPDGDGDGYGKLGSAPQCLCTPPVGLFASATNDCSDANPAVSPKAAEVCDDIDNNCNGQNDEGCDDDGDGWCDAKMVVVGEPVVCVMGKKDCDDNAPKVSPGTPETCGNGIDDNCDGQTDTDVNALGCGMYYTDADQDGFGYGPVWCLCGPTGAITATNKKDCDDNAPLINPGQPEVCGDSKDNNCNGLQDEPGATGCNDYLPDADKDGYGGSGPAKCLCQPNYPYTAQLGGDCNDDVANVNPKAAELCNGIDDNCDGQTDTADAKNCTPYFVDGDKDGFGSDAVAAKCLCQPTAPYSALAGGDCNDADKATFPKAPEACDGKDTDCDGVKDNEGAAGCKNFYTDGDNDGFGVNASPCVCGPYPPYTAAKGGDCNDASASIFPGAGEVCNAIDDNCNGVTDEFAAGKQPFYADADGDGYGSGAGVELCAAKAPYTSSKFGDCDDNDKAAFPGATEIQCDGKDQDCDGKDACNQPPAHICDTNCGAKTIPGVACSCDLFCILSQNCCNANGTAGDILCFGSKCGQCNL